MIHHVFAEIALPAIGTRHGGAVLCVAIPTASNIFRRADLNIAGTAIGVVVRGTGHGNLIASGAGCKRNA